MEQVFNRIRLASPRWFNRNSLTGTLVRTLLIFTFIPLTLMAGAAYFRTRTLLREQVINQTNNQITAEMQEVSQEIKTKEIRLDRLTRRSDFSRLLDLVFQVNPQTSEFSFIRENILSTFNLVNNEGSPTFNQFFVISPDNRIIVASNPAWEGLFLQNDDFTQLNSSDNRSGLINNLDPLYPGKLILATFAAFHYSSDMGETAGSIVGVTESENLQTLLLTLVESNPLSIAYFITPGGSFITNDPYTNELVTLEDVEERRQAILPVLADMVSGEGFKSAPIEFKDQGNQAQLVHVEWIPALNAGVALEFDQRELYAPLNSLVPFTLILFLLSLIAMGLVIILSTLRIINPLQNLTDITRKFARGDLASRAEVRQRKDEIGELASSFNQMADELNDLYRSLELKVNERTRQIRTAAAIAQNLTTLTSLDDLLNKTVELLVTQFEFYEAHIFIIDRVGRMATLRAARGPAAANLLDRGHKLEVGSASIIGWVSANNQARVASDVSEDPVHFKNELLPETKAEASVPISVGSLVLGVLDVQSTQPGAFSPETVVMLETLASQIAVAIQNLGLVESTQVNFQELTRLYRASLVIAGAKSEEEILEITGKVFRDAPFPVMLLAAHESDVEILTIADSPNVIGATLEFQRFIQADIKKLQATFQGGAIITDAQDGNLPSPLPSIVQRLGFETAAYLPIWRGSDIAALAILGAKQKILSNSLIQPYTNLTDLVSATLEKIWQVGLSTKHASEMEALSSISQALSSTQDMANFYATLHQHVREFIGDHSFTVALYDEKKNSIRIPYNFDENKLTGVESFPLGEGLTSILIHTRQPLLIVHDTVRQAAALGAKVIGKPARSWMGAPMIIQDAVVGALIIQDLEREYAFNQDNLKFFTSIADQVAGVIHNARLLEESQRRSLQLGIAAEIARDISGSQNLDELLVKAINLIRERFNFYHAAVFLIDAPGEFAVIREATGEAGVQFKRIGHRIGVGSKSIVGFVSGRGERLVVNDTTKDATYYANPLLPETRAEAAIPLKVGDRILGVLDVQSDEPFAFTEDNLRSMQILSDQLAIAVVNTELFAETQEHLSQHRLLHHITTTAASGTTLEEALEGAVNGLQVTLGGDRVAILLADRVEQILEVKALVGYSEDVTRLKIPFGSGVTGWVAAHRRALRLNDVNKDSRYIQASPNTRSELAVPMIYRNELLGVINVESEQLDAYSDNDEEMLGILSGSLAAIIANARLLEQIREKAERERTIYEITGKIRKSTDIQSILATTASELTKVVGARRTKIEVVPQELNPDGTES